LGTRLPEGVRVVAVEETQDTIHLVLPGAPTAGREGVELSDRDLESVAGVNMTPGWTGSDETCDFEAASREVIDE
jgi:hypothetical protein